MSEKDSRKGKIIPFPNSNRKKVTDQNLIKEVLDRARKKPKRSNTTDLPKKESAPLSPGRISVEGSNNMVAGRDMNVHGVVNIGPPPKKVVTKKFTPGPEHISTAQAKKIKDKIDNLVKKEVAAGMQSGKAYKRWWGKLKNKYEVTTYKEIPAHLGEEAVSWITQQAAIKRTKVRRNNNAMWRKELYTGIYSKANELNISKGEIYNIVYQRMGKRISSLTQLREQNLKKLYNIIRAIK